METLAVLESVFLLSTGALEHVSNHLSQHQAKPSKRTNNEAGEAHPSRCVVRRGDDESITVGSLTGFEGRR